MNLLLVPIVLVVFAYFVSAVIDVAWKKQTLCKMDLFFAKKGVVGAGVAMVALSWGYNIFIRIY